MFRKIIAFTLILSFLVEQSGYAQVAPSVNIAAVPAVSVFDRFRPVQLRSLVYDRALNGFNLLVDKGDQRSISQDEISSEAGRLMTYFRIGVALPNSAFWVNLRPDSPDKVIDPDLERTGMGKVFLEADLALKKDMAIATSPASATGRAYWSRLYARAEELYGSREVTIPTLTRPWIVPGEIIIRQSTDRAYVYKASLDVKLEQDMLKSSKEYTFADEIQKELNEYSTCLIRELILPVLVKKVNSSRTYAAFRQAYYSLVLAQWFKRNFRGTQVQYASLIDTRDLSGLTLSSSCPTESYFNEYKRSFSQGEYNVSEKVPGADGMHVRNYVSGGFEAGEMFLDERMGSSTIEIAPKAGLIPKGIIALDGATLAPIAANGVEKAAFDGGTKQPDYKETVRILDEAARDGGFRKMINEDRRGNPRVFKNVDSLVAAVRETREWDSLSTDEVERADHVVSFSVEKAGYTKDDMKKGISALGEDFQGLRPVYMRKKDFGSDIKKGIILSLVGGAAGFGVALLVGAPVIACVLGAAYAVMFGFGLKAEYRLNDLFFREMIYTNAIRQLEISASPDPQRLAKVYALVDNISKRTIDRNSDVRLEVNRIRKKIREGQFSSWELWKVKSLVNEKKMYHSLKYLGSVSFIISLPIFALVSLLTLKDAGFAIEQLFADFVVSQLMFFYLVSDFPVWVKKRQFAIDVKRLLDDEIASRDGGTMVDGGLKDPELKSLVSHIRWLKSSNVLLHDPSWENAEDAGKKIVKDRYSKEELGKAVKIIEAEPWKFSLFPMVSVGWLMGNIIKYLPIGIGIGAYVAISDGIPMLTALLDGVAGAVTLSVLIEYFFDRRSYIAQRKARYEEWMLMLTTAADLGQDSFARILPLIIKLKRFAATTDFDSIEPFYNEIGSDLEWKKDYSLAELDKIEDIFNGLKIKYPLFNKDKQYKQTYLGFINKRIMKARERAGGNPASDGVTLDQKPAELEILIKNGRNESREESLLDRLDEAEAMVRTKGYSADELKEVRRRLKDDWYSRNIPGIRILAGHAAVTAAFVAGGAALVIFWGSIPFDIALSAVVITLLAFLEAFKRFTVSSFNRDQFFKDADRLLALGSRSDRPSFMEIYKFLEKIRFDLDKADFQENVYSVSESLKKDGLSYTSAELNELISMAQERRSYPATARRPDPSQDLFSAGWAFILCCSLVKVFFLPVVFSNPIAMGIVACLFAASLVYGMVKGKSVLHQLRFFRRDYRNRYALAGIVGNLQGVPVSDETAASSESELLVFSSDKVKDIVRFFKDTREQFVWSHNLEKRLSAAEDAIRRMDLSKEELGELKQTLEKEQESIYTLSPEKVKREWAGTLLFSLVAFGGVAGVIATVGFFVPAFFMPIALCSLGVFIGGCAWMVRSERNYMKEAQEELRQFSKDAVLMVSLMQKTEPLSLSKIYSSYADMLVVYGHWQEAADESFERAKRILGKLSDSEVEVLNFLLKEPRAYPYELKTVGGIARGMPWKTGGCIALGVALAAGAVWFGGMWAVALGAVSLISFGGAIWAYFKTVEWRDYYKFSERHQARVRELVEAKVKAIAAPDTAPVKDAVKDGGILNGEPGGIDMRQMEMTAQPETVVPGAVPSVPGQGCSLSDLSRQWVEIRMEITKGGKPFEKIKAFVEVCCSRNDAQKQLSAVTSYLASMLEREEEEATPSSDALKQILIQLG